MKKQYYFPYFNNETTYKPRKPGGYAAFGEGIGAIGDMIPPMQNLYIAITSENATYLLTKETVVVKTTANCVLRDGYILTCRGNSIYMLDVSRDYIWLAEYSSRVSMWVAQRVWIINSADREYYEACWDECQGIH